ncbi:MAG: hypothetical protein AAGG79_03900 [Pseudomonadota bacterium]
MRLPIAILITLAAASCLGGRSGLSDQEIAILDLAKEKTKGARYPILGQLPGEAEVVGSGVDADPAALRRDVEALQGLVPGDDGSGQAPETRATVVELQAMVEQLQRGRLGRPSSDVLEKAAAIDFPKPPPLGE